MSSKEIFITLFIGIVLITHIHSELVVGLMPLEEIGEVDYPAITGEITGMLTEYDAEIYEPDQLLSILTDEGMVKEEIWDEVSAEFLIRKYYFDLLVTGKIYQIKGEVLLNIGLFFYDGEEIQMRERILSGTPDNVLESTKELIRDNLTERISREEEEPVKSFSIGQYREFVEEATNKNKSTKSIKYENISLVKLGEGQNRNYLSVLHNLINSKTKLQSEVEDGVTSNGKLNVRFTLNKSGKIGDIKITDEEFVEKGFESAVINTLSGIDFLPGDDLANYEISFDIVIY